ncbi:hypothetical protein OKW49_002897 [Paraburkholderia youngii]|uniref:hypothetical protein n=1 Tax=Paraburkholderia youngii TaxID=2782701 RepID=UPI003D22DF5F
MPEIPLMFASPAFCQDDFRLFSQKPQVRFLVADSRSMNTLKPDATQVIDAAMAAVEILRSVCGIDLKEAQIDALLCSCYREYISSGALDPKGRVVVLKAAVRSGCINWLRMTSAISARSRYR